MLKNNAYILIIKIRLNFVYYILVKGLNNFFRDWQKIN
jgi:hypothetical protein